MGGIGISGNVSLDMNVQNVVGVHRYDELKDKPKINGVEVSGSKSLDDYGIASKADAEKAASDAAAALENAETNATAIAAETNRATAAEQKNADAISSETTRATEAEQANATAISNEITRAKSAEETNATAISNISGKLNDIKKNKYYVTPEDFGKVSATDCTDLIKTAIEYCQNNGYALCFLGHNYNISSELVITQNIYMFGSDKKATITKTTNNVNSSNIDCIININSNNTNSDKQFILSNITLKGNITTYISDKQVPQYAIYSEKGILQSIIDNIATSGVDTAIYSPTMWNTTIQNCNNLACYASGIIANKETQNCVFINNDVIGPHEYGYWLAGSSSYGLFAGNFVEWAYGATALCLSFYGTPIIGFGSELGSGVKTYIKTNQSKINIIGGCCYNCTGTLFDISNSNVIAEGMDLHANYDDSPACAICNASYSVFSATHCLMRGEFAQSTINSSYVKVNESESGTLNCVTSPTVSSLTTPARNDSNYNLPLHTKHVTAFCGGGYTSYSTLGEHSNEWSPAPPEGSVTFIDTPESTGYGEVFTVIDPHNTYKSTATITATTTNSITFSSPFFDGYRLLKWGMKVVGNESNASATIAYSNDGITFNATITGNFKIGETFSVKKDGINRRDANIAMSQMCLSGPSACRPNMPTNGVMYYDTTLNKPVWYVNGWKDSNGVSV